MNKPATSAVDTLAPCGLFTSDAESIKERIYVQIKPDLQRIEAEIKARLTTSVPLISKVGQYILGSGGKRLRPLLMILAARLCGYQDNHDAPLAVVFEFLHTSSLLHDDVVDHAEFRRNQPAANKIWGNPAVVLVGDFLYSKSILMTVEYANIRILQVLSEATTKMAEGEVLQLIHADDLEITEEEYLQVIIRKTAVLISAACHIGAIFGGGDTAQEQALKSYGHNLGIAFQLIDDTLDYTGDAKELGKPVGNDIQEGKATLPLIHTFRNQNAAGQKKLRKIFSAEEILAEDFHEVRDMVARSGGIEYTRRRAIQHVLEAKEAIQVFSPHPTRQLLQDIADYVICRRV